MRVRGVIIRLYTSIYIELKITDLKHNNIVAYSRLRDMGEFNNENIEKACHSIKKQPHQPNSHIHPDINTLRLFSIYSHFENNNNK